MRFTLADEDDIRSEMRVWQTLIFFRLPFYSF